MTYEQYWYGDPMMVGAFHKAEKLRRERDDAYHWMQGFYVKKALESTVGNVFRQKGSQPAEYPEAPVLLEEKRRQQKETAEKKLENETAFARAYMLQMMQAGKNWGKR